VTHAHTLAEWLAFTSLGVSGYSAFSAPYFLLVDADLADFDPRPLLGRAGDRLLVEVVNARYALRDAAVSLAALYMILTTTPGDAR
jgi:hypothetical protein